MSSIIVGRKSWGGGRDEKGHRTYKVTFEIECEREDGPATILQTPGLPYYGQPWVFVDATSNDVDVWAYCKMPVELTQKPDENSGEPATQWEATCTFTTIPDGKRCHEEQIDDPLLIPDRISGSLSKYTEEASVDRFGRPIQTSSHEQIRGPQVEFDANRDVIRIEQNVIDLQLPMLVGMRDTVNEDVLWGFPSRCVKLSSYAWEKKYYGVCEVYYTRALEFETNPNSFDRDLLDEGTKVLHGHWNEDLGTGSAAQTDWVLDDIGISAPDPSNPQHFDRFKDRNGENCKVVLNGAGLPAGATVTLDGPHFVAVNRPPGAGGIGFPPSNVGMPLSNTRWWRRVNGETDPAFITAWSTFQTYAAGELVTSGGKTYIAAYKNGSGTNSYPPSAYPNMWLDLGASLTNAGNYDSTVVYTLGQYVSPQLTPTTAGYIHVEKYPESDFLLLGIPATI